MTPHPLLTYSQTINHLSNLKRLGIRFGLEEFRTLLKRLNDPHEGLKYILVGGTNGKGSTCAMLSSILKQSGYRIGLYTSPHLERFTERIKVNGREISEKDVVRLCNMVKSAIEDGDQITIHDPQFYITFFEFTTAVALVYFKEKGVELAVLEVGMGGRLDATNVVDPIASVITNVYKDHEEFLGESVLEIANEKAGIIKENRVLVTGVGDTRSVKLLTKVCQRKNSDLRIYGKEFSIRVNEKGFSYVGNKFNIKGLQTNLKGKHQYKNASLALATIEVLKERGFVVKEGAIRKGLLKVLWPGRLELFTPQDISQIKGRVLLDCAHNPGGVKTLKQFLLDEIDFKRLILILGILKDKDVKGIVSILAPMADHIIVTCPLKDRSAPLDILFQEVSKHHTRVEGVERVEEACRYGLSLLGEEDLMCVTGSIFTVGEARGFLLKNLNTTDGRY